ncbi:histidine-type phosphatase [Sphingomonas abietis]|uniref:Histidine-type phosphatase n=1 Tax=Sphingomonas abietis TaxID=3012344 RepID=A0ABY7NMU7_9SPHN|nr:histidine-type phosphatase [Sphingomonas abietis]WBO22834.1 histidine-type phosphatase [Sphingomonas abietis]
MRLWLGGLSMLMALAAGISATAAEPRYRVDRVVMLIRHGVRAPLDGEAAAAKLASRPFPRWSTRQGFLTPHGAAALRLIGAYDRSRLIGQGILAKTGCPAGGSVSIWANTTERTIASGHALADGLAPGCGLPVRHRPDGQMDPLFDAIESGQVPLDAPRAVLSINRELQDGRALMRGQRPAFATMAHILGCDRGPRPCRLAAMPNRIEVGPDGKGIRLGGPINLASGTAQVFLMQYAEGLPMAEVGWGRATAPRIAQISSLHAKMFDVYARSHAMAPRVGGLLARRICAALAAPTGPKLTVFVGHDNNIAAVTALLGVDFRIAGYGANDPPPGGAVVFERLRDVATGRHSVRLVYIAQTPDQMRRLTRFGAQARPVLLTLHMRACKSDICDLRRAGAALQSSM